jgi:hypothetical protein
VVDDAEVWEGCVDVLCVVEEFTGEELRPVSDRIERGEGED